MKTTSHPRQDDPRASMTIVVALIGALIVFVIIVALQAFFYNSEEAERVSKTYTEIPEELAALRAQQQVQLNSYHWIDQAKGVVAIPIDRAMELTVRDQGQLPAASLPAPAPAANPTGTNP